MKLVRRLAAAAGALALSTGLASVTAPAQAATTPTVTIKVTDYSNPTHPRYGDYVSVTAEASGPTSSDYISTGSLQIQMAPLGSSAWRNVGTAGTSYAYYSVDGLTSKVQFRAVFGGGTGGYPTVTYSAANSTVAAISSLDRGEKLAKQTKHKACYRVGPAPYKNKPIKYYVKVGKSKKWRFSGVTRTNKKSQYCFKLSHKKTKIKKYKGPKVKAYKTVYVKSGGMKKSVIVNKF